MAVSRLNVLIPMPPLSLVRVVALSLAGVCAPALLTQCANTGTTTTSSRSKNKSYKDVSYSPAKLKTPAGHGMERKDYPFDEQGNYRKDWVKNNTSGRDASARVGSSTQVASSAAKVESGGLTPVSYPTYAEASAARTSDGGFVGPAGESGPVELASASGSAPAASSPPPTAPAAKYHKVVSGDTLFSLAGKYRTSVSDLKRINGLSGDSIRVGQSLRLP